MKDGVYWVMWDNDLDHISEWTDGEHGDEPCTYATRREAVAAIDQFIAGQHEAFEAGDMDEKYSRRRFKTRQAVIALQGTVWFIDKNEPVSLQQLQHDAGRTA